MVPQPVRLGCVVQQRGVAGPESSWPLGKNGSVMPRGDRSGALQLVDSTVGADVKSPGCGRKVAIPGVSLEVPWRSVKFGTLLRNGWYDGGVVAKSNPERQAAYRARQGRHSRAVHLWLAGSDKGALKRLARRRGLTQVELIAALLRQAEDAATAGMDDGQIDDYYGGVTKRHSSGQAQAHSC